jgi:hypothetical protein
MQLDAILEVAIGLVFVWLVISVATMETQNRISTLLNWRADYLERSILSMLKDKELVENFYSHPLITELFYKDKNGNYKRDKRGKIYRPEYIPNTTFSTVALEVIMNAGREGKRIPVNTMSIREMTESVKSLANKNPNLADMTPYLFPGIDKARGSLEEKIKEYRTNTENWFNDVMGQTSNWYKIRAQWLAFWIGLILAVTLNIDTIQIAQKLWQEPTARAVLVAQAQAEALNDAPSQSISFETAKNLNIPVGWTTTPMDNKRCGIVGIIENRFVIRSAGECLAVTSLPAFNNGWGIIVKLFGYLLSAAAAAQGAPFWFDILRKMVGVKQQTSQESKA